jgi:hypothetical protein
MPQKGILVAKWEGLGNADSGTALDGARYPDKTITILGTFGGATVVIEGSNDGGTTWHTLNDSRGEGNSFSVTDEDTRVLLENPLLIRPSTSGGTGTDVDVICVAQSQR